MSGAVKQRAAVPSSDKITSMARSLSQDSSYTDPKGTSNGSATLSYPAEASDDVNMNQVDGLVSLDVILPDGKQMDITVDYNTPMRDLLVCIAGKSKLSPSGLLLLLLSEDNETTLTYKPNEVIGALGGRQVRLVKKKDKDSFKKNKSGKKSFEITNRFTMNLPRGQKAVVRVSPAMPLGDLMASVCQDKDLDPRRHFLQLPGKPGIPIDLSTTVGQLGSFEISLISNSSIQERTIANSMPDLSQVPTCMPNAGETKKKRGFLSFLKKDKSKFKPHDTLYETSSTASHRMGQHQPPPSNQRRVSDTGFESSRPKSMFITSNPNPTEFSLPPRENSNSVSQENIAPMRKKRRAPAPPSPSETISPSPKQDINANNSNNNTNKEINIATTTSSLSSSSSSSSSSQQNNSNQREAASSAAVSVNNKSQSAAAAAPSRAEMLSRLHSRNSSDSSGYHELTLSGCESPEAGHTLTSKSKISIDSASIESSDINNGADSGTHESPVRVSPIEEVLEKPDASLSSYATLPPPSSTAASSHDATVTSEKKDDNSEHYTTKSTTLPLPSRKKKKAPAPPAPSVHIPSPTPPPPPPTQQQQQAAHETIVVTAEITTVAASAAPIDATTADLQEDQYQSVQEPRESLPAPASTEVPTESNVSVISPPDSFNDDSTSTPISTTHTAAVDASTMPEFQMNEDPDLSDEDINNAFDIDDILNGVTFDDEPKPLEIKTFSMLNNDGNDDDDEKDDDRAMMTMMMMETSSIASENIEQPDTLSKSERPCAFIPPPPPTEPPPPEVEAVSVESLNASIGPVLIDKGTEVNDDNTSLAPASMKNSPESDRHLPNHHPYHHPHQHHHRTGSFSSVWSIGSVDTIEGLSLDFQVAIRMGEESLNPCLDDVEVSQDGYKNEMALFVERMSKMAVDNNNPESRDTNALNDSLSSGLSLSETNSDTGSVIQHLRTDSGDSRSGVDSGSWSKKDAIRINGIQESEHEDAPEVLNTSSPVEMVPPPPEFGDARDKKAVDIVLDNQEAQDGEDEEEEEEVIETIEELIIPLGPDGPDFTAARKVDESESRKLSEPSEDTAVNNGVFRAEPVSIKPASTKPVEKETKKEIVKKPQEKEEFILTTDDLTNVSFLPPRRKTSTSSRKSTSSLYESPRSPSTSSAVLIMDKKLTSHRDEDSSTDSIQNRMSQLSFTPKSEPENHSMLEVKSISLLNRPTMKQPPPSNRDSPPVIFEDDNNPVFVSHKTNTSVSPEIDERVSVSLSVANGPNKKESELIEDRSSFSASRSSLNSSQNKDDSNSNNNDLEDDAVDGPGSRSSPHSQQQQDSSQYDMLHVQFAQWQEQLATNQNILSQATANDLQADQLQQLKAQMATQQNMMTQIQATMEALQHQQQPPTVNGGHGDKASSVEFPSVDVEQAAASVEPPPPPPPPPLPPAASSGFGLKSSETPAFGQGLLTKAKPRPKAKFERELDPREHLMIAIRSFSGREGLKSVAKKDTKWIHSNR